MITNDSTSAEGCELCWAVPDADAEDESTARQHVMGGRLFGDQGRVSARQYNDGGAQTEIWNDVHERCECDQWLEEWCRLEAALLSGVEDPVVGPDPFYPSSAAAFAAVRIAPSIDSDP